MNPEKMSSTAGPMIWTFLAGAAVGAVVVALTTPKTGSQLRGDLKGMARRARRQAGDLAEDASEAWDGLKARAGLGATADHDKVDGHNELHA
jgi:gas vesicle protein